MNSGVGWRRDGRNWHVEDGVIKLPVTEPPLSIYQYELWQAEKMNWMWMNGYEEKKEKSKAKPLYLSRKENRVYVETRGAFYGETIFCLISVCWCKALYWKTADVIHSLGRWDAQETNLLIHWNWMYFSCYRLNHFPVPLFLAYCLQMQLLLSLNSLHLRRLMFVLFQAWVP